LINTASSSLRRWLTPPPPNDQEQRLAAHRTAALNLRRMLILGLRRQNGPWAIA